MLDIFNTYATDEKAEAEGVVIDLGSGANMTVARSGNDNYIERILVEGEKYKETLAAKTPEAKELDKKITTEVLADTILLGFEGISFKGKKLPYSRANAIKLLGVKDFRKKVIEEASKFENYKAKLETADAKK